MAVWLSLSLSQGTPNVTARTTTVSAKLTIHYDGGSYDGTQPSGEITIDGQSFPFVKNFNYAGVGQGPSTTDTGSTSVTVTATVSYGTSSSRTVNASASFSRASGGASGSITLTPIGTSSGGSSGGGDDDDDNTEEWNPDNPESGSGSGSATGNVTVVGQSGLPTSDEPSYQTKGAVPISCGLLTYACAVKIITPRFFGESQSLDVDLYVESSWGTDDLLMCYALCDSDENHHLYVDAQSVVNDPHQIVCGTLSRYEVAKPFSIQTNKLVGNNDYYLIFWLPSDLGLFEAASFGAVTGHSINLRVTGGILPGGDSGGDSGDGDDSGDIGGDSGDEEIVTPSARGVFYISNGTEFTEYELFFCNGESFEPVSSPGSSYQSYTGTFTMENGAALVDCGFLPDMVVFDGGEVYYDDFGTSRNTACAPVNKDGSQTSALLFITSESRPTGTMNLVISQDATMPTGFKVIGAKFSLEWEWRDIDHEISYTAIKYT